MNVVLLEVFSNRPALGNVLPQRGTDLGIFVLLSRSTRGPSSASTRDLAGHLSQPSCPRQSSPEFSQVVLSLAPAERAAHGSLRSILRTFGSVLPDFCRGELGCKPVRGDRSCNLAGRRWSHRLMSRTRCLRIGSMQLSTNPRPTKTRIRVAQAATRRVGCIPKMSVDAELHIAVVVTCLERSQAENPWAGMDSMR